MFANSCISIIFYNSYAAIQHLEEVALVSQYYDHKVQSFLVATHMGFYGESVPHSIMFHICVEDSAFVEPLGFPKSLLAGWD